MAQAFGPENARLTVRTGRSGAAGKAGHDLLIEVTAWSGTLDPDGDPAITLSADPRSLRVIEGTGGMQALDEGDRAGIEQTIDDEVLKGTAIDFRSTRFDGLPGRVEGELELAGARQPIGFELAPGEDGGVTGTAIVKQSDWGMKPYSTLFGTLKVADEVEVRVETRPHAG